VQLGHHISQVVRDLVALELHALVTEALSMGVKVDWPAALSKAYLRADAKVLQLKGQQKVSQSRVLDSRHAGTTGTTAVLDGLQLHIASVGDSRVILGKVHALTHTHTRFDLRTCNSLWILPGHAKDARSSFGKGQS
jgi:serine/threonine protein phosphatase PrpC